jgi:diadenosine tetraphosphate (Ap4A) HIT family hydrolase
MADECGICKANRGEPPAPGGVIYDDGVWRVDHYFPPIPLLGWLLVKPRRHVTTIADLNADEAARIGPLLQRVAASLTAELASTKVYVANFAEGGEAFAHIHFHVMPRSATHPAEFRGPRVFGLWAKAAEQGDLAPLADVEALVARLRTALAKA